MVVMHSDHWRNGGAGRAARRPLEARGGGHGVAGQQGGVVVMQNGGLVMVVMSGGGRGEVCKGSRTGPWLQHSCKQTQWQAAVAAAELSRSCRE